MPVGDPWGIQEMKRWDMVGRHFMDIWHTNFWQEAEKQMTVFLTGRHSAFEAIINRARKRASLSRSASSAFFRSVTSRNIISFAISPLAFAIGE